MNAANNYNLQTCDILICSGDGTLPGRIKQYNRRRRAAGEAAQITHIALVAMAGLDVFESTTLNPWADGGRGLRGTQINPLSDWLRNYPGRVWVRPLQFERNGLFEEKAAEAMADLLGRPYESGIPGAMELALSGIEWPWFRRVFYTMQKVSTWNLHCSEASAKVLMRLGLLVSRDWNGREVRAHKLPPYRWWTGGLIENLINLNRCRIGEPRQLK